MIFLGEIYSSTSNPLPEGTTMELMVDEKRVKLTFPFKSYRLPAGNYRANIKNVELGIWKEVRFVVEESKRKEIKIDLEE